MDGVGPIDLRTAIIARFQTMVGMVGQVRGMIVSGPPGLGKSYGIEKELTKKQRTTKFVRGGLSAIGLYTKLWETRGENFTLVIDDCDDILFNREGITLLKAAFDTLNPRVIQWTKQNVNLEKMGIEKEFEYYGQIIFITNLDFNNANSKRQQKDFNALMSRAPYLDLELDSLSAKLIRCSLALEEGMLPKMSAEERATLFEYLRDYRSYFGEISLRTLAKLADLKSEFENWEMYAATTLMNKPPDEAYKKFHPTGEGMDLLGSNQSLYFAEAEFVEIELFGETSLVSRFSQEAGEEENRETYNRIEFVDDFFLTTRFSQRPTIKKGNSLEEVAKARNIPDFKLPNLNQDQAGELYDFIIGNIASFENISETELKKMVRVYKTAPDDWKSVLSATLTRKHITYNVKKP